MEDKKDFIGIIQENGGLIYKVARVYTNTRGTRKTCTRILYTSFGTVSALFVMKLK
jgi:hypothetical protein